MKTCLTWKSITDQGGILLTPLFPIIVLLLSLLPRSGTQREEKQRKKRNESQGEIGEQRELRTQKGKLELITCREPSNKETPLLVFLLLSIIFQLAGKVFLFGVPIHQILEGKCKVQATQLLVATPYIHGALCSVAHSSQQDGEREGWRDGAHIIHSSQCQEAPNA